MSWQFARSVIDSRRWAGLVGIVAVLITLFGLAPSARATELPQISGKVTAAPMQTPLEGVEVCAYAMGGGEGHKCTSTDSGGEYELSGLVAGSYAVEFSDVTPG